jgi:hypothetical protein
MDGPLQAFVVERPVGEGVEVERGRILAMAHQHDFGPLLAGEARDAGTDFGHPDLHVVVVPHRQEVDPGALFLAQREPDHLHPLLPRERVARGACLPRRADHDHAARRESDGPSQQRQLRVVQDLEAADADGDVGLGRAHSDSLGKPNTWRR